MKACQIWGDTGADRVADQYPTVPVCDECFTKYYGKEDSPIVSGPDSYDPAYGDECHFCDISAEEEGI
ncbi:hypothetical protein AAFM71_07630 [Chromobacterium violaceum]|uniref:hypothetical protein n=1 Tax=Chromobacterium violaceum TaxID=536 RepID=UPI003859591F